MEMRNPVEKLLPLIKKYRYAALILLIGIVLMLLPSGKDKNAEVPSPTVQSEETPSNEYRLGALLSKIDGAGKVEVILSYASGSQTHYQTDTDSDENKRKTDTVIITNADRKESGLITRVDPPVFLGAVVVCQGADRAAVRLAIVDAVSKYTGLGADQISVLKMK